MNFEKIKKNYEKKVEQLLKHNENYYDKNRNYRFLLTNKLST